MAKTLDASHTAVAARIDPRGNYYGAVTDRHFTKEDAAWVESLDSVKALRLHTVSAASSPLFQPLIEMNRHEMFAGHGDRRPYCNAVLSGTLAYGISIDPGNPMPGPARAGELCVYTVKLDEILLLGSEYCSTMAMVDSALRYNGSFHIVVYLTDQEAADFFQEGKSYVFSGYYDAGNQLFSSLYTDYRQVLVLGGVRVADGILMGGYDYPASYRSPENPVHPDTVYAFPAAQLLEDGGEAVKADPESFFENTQHEIWRDFRKTWETQQHSLPVIGTDKLETMYSFLSQRAVIKEGRAFTEEEYENGSRVLIVSRQIADRAKLKIGDTLSLQQYNGAFEYTGTLSGLAPLRGLLAYNKTVNNPSIDILNMNQVYGPEETFTLVGIYELEENWAEGSYDFTPNTVFIPRKAQIAGAAGDLPEEGDFFGLTFSFELVNGKVSEFQAAMEASPIEGEFYTFDQGYEAVQENLNVTVRSMGRLLILSLLACCFFQIFYLLMFQGGEKTTLGTMRSLGTTSGRCGAYLWGSGFLVALGGIVLGSEAGRRIMEKVQQGILEDALAGIEASMEENAAALAKAQIRTLMSASRLSDRQLLLIAGAQLALMALLLLLHTALLLKRPPRKLMEG